MGQSVSSPREKVFVLHLWRATVCLTVSIQATFVFLIQVWSLDAVSFPRCVFIGDFYSFGTSLFQVTISGCFISWFVLHLCHPATHIVEHNVPIVSPFPHHQVQ